MIKKENKDKHNVPLIMFIVSVIFVLIALLCKFLYIRTLSIIIKYIGLISATVVFHFVIMFFSAPMVAIIFRKKFNYNSFWFRTKNFEKKIYKKLKVRKWKKFLPTYDVSEYSLKKHTVYEVIMNICHAEIVHEVIAVFSYLPIVLGAFVSNWGLLFWTSLIYSFCHLAFAIIQRYNRPRYVCLYRRKFDEEVE